MTYFLDFGGTLADEDGTVYVDTPEFLRAMGNEAIIITMAHDQKGIEERLKGVPRLTIIPTGGRIKADYLADFPHLLPASTIFVDDSIVELERMNEKFPHVSLYEMRRDGGAGDGRWPVIHSLSELP